jgi:hypothetical protein
MSTISVKHKSSCLFCDNHGIVKNVSIPESVLSKNHSAIDYNAVCEAAAGGILQVFKEDIKIN